VAPLFSGTGQRVKLLEAFAMGVPVVTTALGASGLSVRHRQEAFIAETRDEFVNALAALRDSAQLREDMGSRGRRMVVERFEWERLADSFLEVVEPSAPRRMG
jgi:glycosyltransferase involved in cell wall biosynthesis